MQVAARHKGEEGPKLGKDVIEMFMSMAMKYALAYELTEADMDLVAPASIAAITRARKSSEDGFGIPCWPPPSTKLESYSRLHENTPPIQSSRETL